MLDEAPRRPWAHSDRPVPRLVLRPLQEFLSTSTAGGSVLVIATAVALIWANSPWSDAYARLWATGVSIRAGHWAIEHDLRAWVNEGLMALFFLVAGLEIKREMVTGELRDRRTAIAPAVAAVGGMLLPAVIYVAFNAGGAGSQGWGAAMPTDIAFALGLLTLSARAAPPGLKPFLLTLAIVDDLGTIVVLTLFYSSGVSWGPLFLAAVIAGLILAMQRIHVRASAFYLILGVALWLSMERSGIHPALAGVVLGFLTPAVPFQRPRAVSAEAHRIADETVDDPLPADADAHQWLQLTTLSREAVSPLARVEHVLLPWVSFVVLPVFALANAGVALSRHELAHATTSRVTLGLVVGRIVGKVGGICLAVWLLERLGIGRRPEAVTMRHVAGTAAAASVAFTVALFAAGASLAPRELADAKVGVLATVVLGGVCSFLLLRRASAQSR